MSTKQPQVSGPSLQVASERLARIADLRDRGVLTEEEFQREKRKLLR